MTTLNNCSELVETPMNHEKASNSHLGRLLLNDYGLARVFGK